MNWAEVSQPAVDDTHARAPNEVRIEQLSDWIRRNAASNPGWPELTEQSGLSCHELVALFKLYRKTTPMTFIRECRKARRA